MRQAEAIVWKGRQPKYQVVDSGDRIVVATYQSLKSLKACTNTNVSFNLPSRRNNFKNS